MSKEDLTRTIRCGIEYCANTLTLIFNGKNTGEPEQRGWRYVETWETIKDDVAPYICEECWEQSGLKWRK